MCSAAQNEVLNTQLDESFDHLPQKHCLICFDRDLYGQTLLELEVPILELALDHNVNTAMEINDDYLEPIFRRARAYEVSQYTRGVDQNLDVSYLQREQLTQRDNQGR